MSTRSGQQIMNDVAHRAQETFHRNSDTLVAGYLVRHPDVDPADVELVMRVEGSTIKFRIEPKELHVPPAVDIQQEAVTPFSKGEINETEYAHRVHHSQGWNACRDEMLKAAKMVKDQDGTLITLLSETIDG